MRRFILMALGMLVVAGGARAASVVLSKHDLRSLTSGTTPLTEVCVTCHTPHQVTAANGQDPLWNHTLSATATYGVYSSPTMNAVPIELGGASAGSAAVSNLCLSCHDGTVSVFAMYRDPVAGAPTFSAGTVIDATGKLIGGASLGTSLTDDHPINFTYDAALATADNGLVTPASTSEVVAGVPLYNGMVQCASCHNVHDPANVPFLRVDNTGSALCLKCHVK